MRQLAPHAKGRSPQAYEVPRARRGPPPQFQHLLTLQARAGNRAVSQLLSASNQYPSQAQLSTVQRCGDHPCAGDCSSQREDAETPAAAVQRCGDHPCAGDCSSQREEDAETPAAAVQRYADCTQARLSGKECPPRVKGERERARDGPMVFLALNLGTGETGVVIANFDIGKSTIKPNLHSTIYWKQFLQRISADQSRWALVGFSDCQGNEKDNAGLRTGRANAVFGLLPKALQARIDSREGAGSGECLTGNDGPGDRTLNRSVAFLLTEETIDFPAETVKDSLTRKEPKTDACTDDQRKRLAVAVPLAKRLAEHAVAIINSMEKGSREEALLKKFFGPDAYAERHHIRIGYIDALRAWKDLPTYRCVKQGTEPCTGDTSGYTGFRGLVTGSPIIICESSFGDDLELADTVLHEETHALAWTDDNEECGVSGCNLPTTSESLPGIGLTDSGALTNAASYSRFASQAYAQGL
jgi:outer membrane protein OmpA-like peptidoglycan-associated protein